jgi:adenosylcobinamide-GDP ribazoletransferase
MIEREFRRFCTAAMFLTRLPLVARGALAEPAELARSSRYFPLLGALIGALIAAVYALCLQFLPAAVATVLALTAGVVLTGAFHEDGLADTADGLGGSFERARKLEIMRDSRLGTYGTVALMLLLLAKFSALQTLGAWAAVSALVAAHTLARGSSLLLIAWLPYVREGSSNKPIADGVTRTEITIAMASCGIVAVMCAGGLGALLICTTAAMVVLLSGWTFQRQLGGITGDCLGASNQLVEIAVLVIFCARQFPS